MLNAETKKHIDAARDVLVGVAPNPTTQIDQITYALIYKFMDDMDQSAIKAGGEPSFFVGELEPYSWSRLMDSRVGNQEKMNLYADALAKFSEAKQLPELFRTIFRAAFLPYRSPETLGLFLKEISFFDYSHPEELGNAYEYLLSIMSAQGAAGQFRTPRHIIDFIVDVINPTKEDKVLDPACGTGGFLVSSYNHILEQHDGKGVNGGGETPLTPDERKKLMQNFEGYDIDPTMVRIAQVNMYLHQFKNPKITQYDSLTSEEKWSEKFDVILANPPFMTPKGGIKPHTKFSLQSTRAEVLFVDYIASHLRPKGRAGIVVPEGIVFQAGKAYKSLRKNLVEGGLYGVISLPAGVFMPYSGVKTSILLINSELASRTKEVIFIDISSDGFDLGASKRPIEANDLPAALETLEKWHEGTKVDLPNVLYVEKSEILAHREVNLNASRYKAGVDHSKNLWVMKRLDELAEVRKGSAITEKETREGRVPVIAGGQSPAYFHDSSNREGQTITVSASGAYAGFVNFFEEPIFASDCSTIKSLDESVALTAYLFRVLKAMQDEIYELQTGGGQPHIYPKDLVGLEIPLPPIEVQRIVVDETTAYSAIIDGAKKIVENWRPFFKVDPSWPYLTLKDVATWSSGGTPKSSQREYYGGTIPWCIIGDLNEGYVTNTAQNITESGLASSSAKIVPPETVLLAMYGASIGKTGIAGIPLSTNQAIACGQVKTEVMRPEYLLYFLQSQKSRFVAAGTGGAQPNISQMIVKDWPIPVPDLDIQDEILREIRIQKDEIDFLNNLIQRNQAAIASVVEELWSSSEA